ncbi:MAG: hypothetical protein SGI73_22990 [Chloroflexota bacterium]|nr:hypothetical protein [Chloroflexota bacterium]
MRRFVSGKVRLRKTVKTERKTVDQVRVVEEVVLGKEVTEHTETIRDTVRRKDVDVETVGDTTKRNK